MAHPFNFYVFPCEFRGLDKRFLCQTRCMQFLANSSFDFNKLFKAGIPWLNHEEEELIEILKANHMVGNAAQVLKKAQTIMAQGDTDGSGEIDLEEFVVVAKKFPNILFPAYN